MSTILLLDDETTLRGLLAGKLTEMGHEVREAGDGREGMRLFRAATPELVITDLIMPVQEGIETIMELRRLRPDVKIIAMSGTAQAERRWQYLEVARYLGALAVLEKPFSAEQLETTVNRVLG